MTQLTFRPVTKARWPDFEKLFESRGAPKTCWCMTWRARGIEDRQRRGAQRKQAMKERIREGTRVGLLGYLDGEPVAWCSIAPRDTYRDLGGPEKPMKEVWSLVCFFLKRELRGNDYSTQMIDAAIAYARAHDAAILEAYPVDPGSPSFRFMGYVPMFEKAGFTHVGDAGSRRHVMRLELR